MAGLKNIIRKQTVHFQYNGQADGFALQKEVGDWCTHVLMPQLEQQLEKFCIPDWHLTLDKLELTVAVNEANWQEQIQQQVMDALREKLADEEVLLTQLLQATTFTEEKPLNLAKQVPLKGMVVNKKGQLQQRKQSGQQLLTEAETNTAADDKPLVDVTEIPQTERAKAIEQKQATLILFYLQHGYLPWWGSTVLSVPFPQFLQEWLTGSQSADAAKPQQVQKRLQHFVQQLKPLQSDTTITRLVNHLPGNDFFAFVKLAFPEVVQTVLDIQAFITVLLKGNMENAKYQALLQPVYRYWITQYIQGADSKLADTLEQLYQSLTKAKPAVKAAVLQQSTAQAPNPIMAAWQQLLVEKKEIVADKGEQSKVVAKGKQQLPNQIKEIGKEATEPVLEKKVEAATQSPVTKVEQLEELTEGIYIENAGAIIIAPFLPMLFKTLKLTDSGQLIKPDIAALLVQHIVTGQTTISEPELVLPKILCGIDLEAVVATHHKITAQQKKETTEMLASVISHWSLLKNTSVEGLREAFLQRNGKLRIVNDQWLLQVEQKSYDMLLQQLPWNIGMIRLPWMKNLITTEWV